MHTKIGYLIPEFPGQTHMFLWRERQVLASNGVETALVSTRPASRAIASHEWSREAEKLTTYLTPFTTMDLLRSLVAVVKAGPAAIGECLRIVARAKDVPLSKKLRLAALIVIAGKLVNISKAGGWTHIHVHSCADAANIALFASILGKLSYSLTLHGPTLEGYGANQAQKWQHASFGLAVSQKLLDDLKAKLPGSLPERLSMAPMGVNLDVIKREAPYVPWQSGPCRLFSCGRLNVIKGHNFLIETVAMLKARGIDVRLQIAGEDEQGGSGYHRELDRLIAEKGLSDSVELLGAVSEDRIRQGLEEAHMFVLASLNEGTPVAVMEAMAMSMPVVVTDVGANAELIQQGVNGLLVEQQKPKEMADEIERVLRNPKLSMQLSQASRPRIAEAYNHHRSADALAGYLTR